MASSRRRLPRLDAQSQRRRLPEHARRCGAGAFTAYAIGPALTSALLNGRSRAAPHKGACGLRLPDDLDPGLRGASATTEGLEVRPACILSGSSRSVCGRLPRRAGGRPAAGTPPQLRRTIGSSPADPGRAGEVRDGLRGPPELQQAQGERVVGPGWNGSIRSVFAIPPDGLLLQSAGASARPSCDGPRRDRVEAAPPPADARGLRRTRPARGARRPGWRA